MKRFTYHIVTILLPALTACTSDLADDPQPPTPLTAPILFSSNTEAPQPSTRAVGLEQKGVTDFYVWSYKTKGFNPATHEYTGLQTIMDQYRVAWNQNTAGTTSSNVADWEYVGISNPAQPTITQNIKYWDMQASSYRFFAFAPCNASGIVYAPNHTNPELANEYDITFKADAATPEDAPYISHLWFSNNIVDDCPNRLYGQTVTMEFLKPVTKVNILLIDELGNEITDPAAAGITSLTFEPSNGGKIIQKGTLKVSYPLQGVTTFTQYLPKLEIEGDNDGVITMNRIGAKGSANDYSAWYYVLPHIVQNAFQLKLTVSDKSRMTTVPSELMSWNPNIEYTYKFKLTASDVQFIDIVQFGVTKWRTFDVDYSIFNW